MSNNNTVRVYRNLHKKCWSVQKYVPKKGWRLAGHYTYPFYLINARYIVYQSGYRRWLNEGRKNVHAYIEGDIRFFKQILGYKRVLKPSFYQNNKIKYYGGYFLPEINIDTFGIVFFKNEVFLINKYTKELKYEKMACFLAGE